jgi:hypothetical protein
MKKILLVAVLSSLLFFNNVSAANAPLSKDQLKAKIAEIVRMIGVLQAQLVEMQKKDSTLLVAQCQAKRDSDYSSNTEKVNATIEQSTDQLEQQRQTAINNLSYNIAFQINLNNINKYYDSLVNKLKSQTAPFLDQIKSAIDSDYLKCVSQ